MWSPFYLAMEGAALVAIALSTGGGQPPDWQDVVSNVLLLFVNSAIGSFPPPSPGRDLYYFLEQARDHYEPDPPSGRQSFDREREGGCEREANASVLRVCAVGTTATTRTPPTPSLLSTLNEKQLLSRRRLRLIANVFAGECSALR